MAYCAVSFHEENFFTRIIRIDSASMVIRLCAAVNAIKEVFPISFKTIDEKEALRLIESDNYENAEDEITDETENFLERFNWETKDLEGENGSFLNICFRGQSRVIKCTTFQAAALSALAAIMDLGGSDVYVWGSSADDYMDIT